MRPHPECCTTRVYGTFTDLLVLCGRTDYLCYLGLGEWIHNDAKQLTEPVVSPFLLTKQLEINDADTRFELQCKAVAEL